MPGRGTCARVCWLCAAPHITCLGENECVYPSAKERRKKEQVNLPQPADYAFSTSNCQHLFNYFTHYKCVLQPLIWNPSLLLSAPLEVTRSFLRWKSFCGRHLLPGQGLGLLGEHSPALGRELLSLCCPAGAQESTQALRWVLQGVAGVVFKARHSLRQELEEFTRLSQGYRGDPLSQNCIFSKHFHFNSKLKGKFPFWGVVNYRSLL